MEKMTLAITLTDGQTLHAEPRPQDERRLAELLGSRATFEFATSNDDLEGHAMSAEVPVDVEGHAMVLRLPHAADAAALRRALAVGAITATIVGAGAIAGLHPPVQAPTNFVQAPPRAQIQSVPGPALRAQQDEMQRNQAVERAQNLEREQGLEREQSIQALPVDVANPLVPAQVLRAERDEMQREQSLHSVPLDADNPKIPAQALRAERAEMEREQELADDGQ